MLAGENGNDKLSTTLVHLFVVAVVAAAVVVENAKNGMQRIKEKKDKELKWFYILSLYIEC